MFIKINNKYINFDKVNMIGLVYEDSIVIEFESDEKFLFCYEKNIIKEKFKKITNILKNNYLLIAQNDNCSNSYLVINNGDNGKKTSFNNVNYIEKKDNWEYYFSMWNKKLYDIKNENFEKHTIIDWIKRQNIDIMLWVVYKI